MSCEEENRARVLPEPPRLESPCRRPFDLTVHSFACGPPCLGAWLWLFEQADVGVVVEKDLA